MILDVWVLVLLFPQRQQFPCSSFLPPLALIIACPIYLFHA